MRFWCASLAGENTEQLLVRFLNMGIGQREANAVRIASPRRVWTRRQTRCPPVHRSAVPTRAATHGAVRLGSAGFAPMGVPPVPTQLSGPRTLAACKNCIHQLPAAIGGIKTNLEIQQERRTSLHSCRSPGKGPDLVRLGFFLEFGESLHHGLASVVVLAKK